MNEEWMYVCIDGMVWYGMVWYVCMYVCMYVCNAALQIESHLELSNVVDAYFRRKIRENFLRTTFSLLSACMYVCMYVCVSIPPRLLYCSSVTRLGCHSAYSHLVEQSPALVVTSFRGPLSIYVCMYVCMCMYVVCLVLDIITMMHVCMLYIKLLTGNIIYQNWIVCISICMSAWPNLLLRGGKFFRGRLQISLGILNPTRQRPGNFISAFTNTCSRTTLSGQP